MLTNSLLISDKNKSTPIDLKGDLPHPLPLTPVVFESMYLMQYPDYLEASFSCNFEIIEVAITDNVDNNIYQEVVDTSKESLLFIDVSYFEEGDSFIQLVNLSGR